MRRVISTLAMNASTTNSSIKPNATSDARWVMPRLSQKVVLCQSCIDGVDDLGWDAGFTFSCYGAHIGVRVNDQKLLSKALEYLPPHSKPSNKADVEFLYSLRDGNLEKQAANSRIKRFHLLYLNTMRIMRARKLDPVWAHLESALHFNVAMNAPEKLFVHAGVVGWKGGAILFPGRSLSGKSTLVAALVRAGATYYSDEYAVLDEKGRVHPYAKALSMRQPSGAARRVPVEELIEELNEGTHPKLIGSKPLPVSAVVMTQFQEGARWRPREASAGQGVLDLLDNTVLAQQRPGAALSYSNAAVENARIWKSKRGEALDVVESLLK